MNSIKLGEVKGHRPMALICVALFNQFKIKAGGVPIHYDDTVATYAITADEKLTKPKAAEAITFVNGMIAGLRAANVL